MKSSPVKIGIKHRGRPKGSKTAYRGIMQDAQTLGVNYETLYRALTGAPLVRRYRELKRRQARQSHHATNRLKFHSAKK